MGVSVARQDGEVGECIYRELLAHGGGGDWGRPVQQEVVSGQSFRKVP